MATKIWIMIALTGFAACRHPTVDPPDRRGSTPSSKSQAGPGPQNEPGNPAASRATEPRRPDRPRTEDDGLFSEHDDAVVIAFPDWLQNAAKVRVRGPSGDVFSFVNGRAVAMAPDHEVDFQVESFGDADLDDDGIPNGVDILLGAKKAAKNNAPYGSPYREIEYPGGDVPLDEGVCTDALVRIFRNAGLDLQKELHEDILRSPESFPMVDEPNPNIDHRRVKTLLPYFERHWISLSTKLNNDPVWLPGDVVFMDTYGDDRPDHVGVVSDRLGDSGAPLIINNWTNGYSTSAMDIATVAPITHRFRLDTSLRAPEAHRGLAGVLARRGLEVDARHRQVLLVTLPETDVDHGTVRPYRRDGEAWTPVGTPADVTVGSAGLGTGRGLHPDSWDGVGVDKEEGDRRAPAGVFALGTAFGPGEPPYRGDWPWRPVGSDDVFVDDSLSDAYNTWQTGSGDWNSAEKLTMYRLGLVVEHNTDQRVRGAGSAIFLHTWKGDPAPTLGCTAMKRAHLVELLGWLDPDASPVLVQVPGYVW